jgi:PAS domain S-box-containing protein
VTERCEEDAFLRKDGSVEWLTWEVRPWLRADGAVGGMIMLTQVITERKRVAEALRASEARLKSAMQNSPIGMALVAPDGRFLDVNPALCRIVGYSAEELRATNFQTITHPQDLDADLDKLKQVLSRETETYAMEKRYIHKDGREIWIQLNVSADFNEDATPRHLIAQIQDITERKRVNAALKKAEEKFSSVFFGAPVGITICCTRDGRISDVNREFERLSGYARDEAVGRTGVELALWPDVEAAEDYLESVLSGNGPRNVELLLRTKAGKLIPLRHSGHTMHLDGETYLLSAFVDLSERKRAEAAIRESEARLRRVVASPILGIAFGRADGTITEANDEYLRIVGYSREELEAEAVNFRHMTPPEFVHQNARALGELDAKGTSRPWEMELLRKDGERVPVLLGVSVVDAQRGLDVVFVFDLSERRSLERQLLHAQKMEAVGRLAAGVAHDFNNVLSAITMCSDLLRDTPLLGPAATDEVNEIRKAADRGVGLTRQLLAFSRQQVLEPRIIDLNGLVGNLERMLRRLASEDVEVQTQFGPGRATVKADAGQIEQVLMNLVVNAKDAMPQGGTLTIETSIVTLHADHLASDQTQLPPGIYASLSVSDMGTGMTAETAARIFEPFFTTKEIGKGTGLGLSTVYGIVRQSGGAIDVTSVIGQGTSFRILLPHVHKALESIPMSGLPNMVGGKETILVVEGDAAVRQVTRKVLVKLGYRVLDAPNPAAALAMGNSYVGTIDLLLTDLIMPGGSGRTLAAALGAQRPKLCVLYMSGHADDADTTADPSANGDYVLKPFSSTALAHKVRALLDQQRGFAR